MINLNAVTTVVAKDDHTCAINNGKLYCWGKNDVGQLGGSNLSQNRPVIDLSAVSTAATGSSHTCANHTTGKLLYCWGGNDFGQLGPNAMPGGSVNFTQLSSVSILEAGTKHTCAVGNYIGQNGLYCWGLNDSAQLGTLTNSTTNNPNPTPNRIGNFTNVSALTAGSAFTCAVGSYNGASGLYCWGANYDGQLGNPTGMGSSYFAQPLKASLDNVTAITAGFRHACALGSKNGTTGLYCWGRNTYGQVGPNGGTATANPVQVPVPGTVVAVAAGMEHTCAVNNQRQLYCWGHNDFGQLGPLLSQTQTSVPTLITSLASLEPNIMDVLSSGWFEVAR